MSKKCLTTRWHCINSFSFDLSKLILAGICGQELERLPESFTKKIDTHKYQQLIFFNI